MPTRLTKPALNDSSDEHSFDPSQPLKNTRWELFCIVYARTLNGAHAARSAGYKKGGARQQASHLLTNPNIYARARHIHEEVMKRHNITEERLLLELRAGIETTRAMGDYRTLCVYLKLGMTYLGMLRRKIEPPRKSELLAMLKATNQPT